MATASMITATAPRLFFSFHRATEKPTVYMKVVTITKMINICISNPSCV